jgi:hypothetical protein
MTTKRRGKKWARRIAYSLLEKEIGLRIPQWRWELNLSQPELKLVFAALDELCQRFMDRAGGERVPTK